MMLLTMPNLHMNETKINKIQLQQFHIFSFIQTHPVSAGGAGSVETKKLFHLLIFQNKRSGITHIVNKFSSYTPTSIGCWLLQFVDFS